MKLYASIGPNPRVVNMFLVEKGLDPERVEVDLMDGENRREPYLKVNPAGQLPTLELASGARITETVAICEYLEEIVPRPSLIGETPEARATVRMWTRRIDLTVCEPMANGFRFAEGLELFQDRTRCLPEAAAGLKALAQDGLAWVEQQFTGPWVIGDRFSLADIVLYAFVDFGVSVGQPLDPRFKRLTEWFVRAAARPGAVATAG